MTEQFNQQTDQPTTQPTDTPYHKTPCDACGALKWSGEKCYTCQGVTCPICGLVIYHDESVTYNAHGTFHQRCAAAGVPRPRPRRMALMPHLSLG